MIPLLRSASYIFHPLWMPFLGTSFYFMITPRYFPHGVVQAKLLAVAIMTIFIPVVFFFMLKNLQKVDSHLLLEVRERRWPLLFYSGISFVILKFVLDSFDFPELYYFFLGIFSSSLLALIFAMAGRKVSLHMLGLGGLLGFVIHLGLYFDIDLTFTVSTLIAITGLTASSRLTYAAHTNLELILGTALGIIPQVAAAFVLL